MTTFVTSATMHVSVRFTNTMSRECLKYSPCPSPFKTKKTRAVHRQSVKNSLAWFRNVCVRVWYSLTVGSGHDPLLQDSVAHQRPNNPGSAGTHPRVIPPRRSLFLLLTVVQVRHGQGGFPVHHRSVPPFQVRPMFLGLGVCPLPFLLQLLLHQGTQVRLHHDGQPSSLPPFRFGVCRSGILQNSPLPIQTKKSNGSMKNRNGKKRKRGRIEREGDGTDRGRTYATMAAEGGATIRPSHLHVR